MREEDDGTLLMSRPEFEPLAPDEAEALRGGAARKRGVKAGTCLAVGYACSSSGSIGVGVCVIVGYAYS